jgi:aspartyl-tRNA(Asn)/glutamyl-tRNA(Gln) amidotransferase subunit C
VAVTPDQVSAVAALARLELDDEQAVAMARQLTRILDHMAELGAVDMGGAEPVSPVPERAPLRSDDPAPDPLAFSPARMAPAWDQGFFTVPRLPALGNATAPESPTDTP